MIHNYLLNLSHLNNQLKELVRSQDKKMKTQKGVQAAMLDSREDHENAMEQIMLDFSVMSAEADDMREHVSALTVENEALKAKVASHQSTVQLLEGQNELAGMAENGGDGLKEKLEEVKKELEESKGLKEELEQVKKELEEVKKSEEENTEEDIQVVQSRLEEQSALLESSMSELEEVKTSSAELTHKVDELENVKTTLEQEVGAITSQMNELRTQLDQTKALRDQTLIDEEALKAQLELVQKKVVELEEGTQKQAGEDLHLANQALKQKQEEVDLVKADLTKKEEELVLVQTKLEETTLDKERSDQERDQKSKALLEELEGEKLGLVKEVEEKEQEYLEKMKELEEVHEKKLEGLSKEHEKKLEGLCEEHEKKATEWETETQAAQAAFEAQRKALTTTHLEQTLALEATIANHAQSTLELTQAHQATLQDLEAGFQVTLASTIQDQTALADSRVERAQQESAALVEEYKRRYTQESAERKRVHNALMELKGNIRVFCRVRPVLQYERDQASQDGTTDLLATSFPLDKELVLEREDGMRNEFEFDEVFQMEAAQTHIFESVEPLVTSVVDGFNVCIFAYGQTGSGKTHTMEGPPEDRGVNLRALETLFQVKQQREESGNVKIQLSVSVLEIYNEMVSVLVIVVDVLTPRAFHK